MSWKVAGVITSALFVILSAALSAIVLAVYSNQTEAATTPPIVATPVGRFVGVITTSETYGESYVSYRSIPYAKPPIGELRFKRPQSLEETESSRIVNSDQYQKSCWSVTKKSTDPSYGEDCLYLNIYVPGAGEVTRTLPVMVWIHGGGFVAGSTFPEPDKLVLRGDVIVVTINYRLGVFGFLTTEDEALPSNNGLWDQSMSIKWVKDHIKYFGGDDASITLFGESSGAVSSALHSISPVSSGFFNKVILQSGGATGLISRDARQRAHNFANLVGCSRYSSATELADCLRHLSVEVILKFSKPSVFNISLAQRQIDFIWMPIVDGEFIPDEPLKLLSNTTYMQGVGAFSKDFLIGVVNDEGALIVQNFINAIPLSQLSDIDFMKDLTDFLLHGRYGSTYIHSQQLKEHIYSFYGGSPLLSSAPRPQSVLDLAGDVTFNVPAIEMALSLSSCHESVIPSCLVNSSGTQFINCSKTTSKTFLYHFDYCPESDQCTAPCMTHGADVAYEFPRTIFHDPIQQEISDMFVDILTTFAKTSDPGSVLKSGWPTFDTASQSYLRLDNFPSVRQYLYDYRVNFWLKQIPSLLPHTSRT